MGSEIHSHDTTDRRSACRPTGGIVFAVQPNPLGMNCDHIDSDTALRAIQKTRDSGNEHAFAVCSDGSTSDIVEGTERQVNIDIDCNGQAGIFHVHPNDVMHLSDQDVSVLEHEAIDMVCVADTQGNMKCELDGEDFACAADLKDSGSKSLNATDDAPHALYESGDGEKVALALLPKGSRCVDHKSVPSRSDYHNSDSVDRCDKFSTDGKGKSRDTSDDDDTDDSTGEYDGDEYPMEVNGWEHFDPSGDATVVGWYRPSYNESNPEYPYEAVEITDRTKVSGSGGGGFSVETRRYDADLSGWESGGGKSLMPKKTSGYGRYDSVSFSRAVDLATEHMEEYDPFDFDWSYAPDVKISGEAREFRYLSDAVNRGYDRKGLAWGNLSLTDTRAEVKVTDPANVLAGILTVDADAYDTWNVSKQSNVKVNHDKLADLIRNANITDTLRLETGETAEELPPTLDVYADGTRVGYVYLFPSSERLRDIGIDDDVKSGFQATARVEGHEFKKAVKWMKIAGSLDGTAAIRSDGDEADMIAEGDVDTARAVLDEDPDGGRVASFYSMEYLRPLSMVPRPKSTKVRLKWADEYPLEFRYGGEGFTFVQYLAPRVSDGNAWDISMEQAKEPGDGPCPYFDDRLVLNSYDLESEGDTILWFHPKAEGCRCSSQAVQMDEIAQNHPAQVVGVNTETETHNEAFTDAYDLSFPIVSDTDRELIERFDVPLDDDGRPERTTVFVRDGEEIDRVHGLFSSDDAAERLEAPTVNDCGCGGHSVEERPEVLEYVEHPSVATITGQRRSGKSSLAYHVANEMHKHDGVTPVTVNVPDTVADKLPDHWVHVSSIRNAPNDSVVVYDEAYRSIHSRTPHSDENLDLTEIVELSAQRGQSLLFVTQNSAILDKVAVGESDVMFVKKPGKLSMKFERSGIRDLSSEARERFDMLPEDADHREYVFVYGEDGEAFVKNGEASFYGDDISKSFACRDASDDDRELLIHSDD